MAKKYKIFSQVFLALLVGLVLGFAANYRTTAFACGSDEPVGYDENGNPIIANCSETEDETFEDEYSAADSSLVSERSVAHSFFLAGNEIISKDDVSGINFAAGNLVELAGTSEYAALAGNSVKISGIVEEDLFVASNSVEITEDAYIGRDVFGFGNAVLLKANLYGNAFLAGNRLVLENVTIDGNLNADFDEIVIKGRSAISGTFNYNENAKITGLENLSTGATETFANASISFSESLSEKIVFFAGGLLVAFVLATLAPKFAKKLLNSFVWATSWKHLALGLVLLVLVPLCAVVSLVTIVGLPIACVALGLYFTFICISSYVTGGVLGDQLTKLPQLAFLKKAGKNIYFKILLGSVLIFLLEFIPVVGGLVKALSLCFGFGYLAKRLFVRK